MLFHEVWAIPCCFMRCGPSHVDCFMRCGPSHVDCFMRCGPSHVDCFMRCGPSHVDCFISVGHPILRCGLLRCTYHEELHVIASLHLMSVVS